MHLFETFLLPVRANEFMFSKLYAIFAGIPRRHRPSATTAGAKVIIAGCGNQIAMAASPPAGRAASVVFVHTWSPSFWRTVSASNSRLAFCKVSMSHSNSHDVKSIRARVPSS